jgi:uncharacterized membrane protein YdjX (TVP38/TMEM64 family)
MSDPHHSRPLVVTTRRFAWRKVGLGLLLVAIAIVAIVVFRDRISVEALAAQETHLRQWYRDQPLLALTIAFAIYFTLTSLSVPTIWPLTVVYGWLFGFWPALLVVSFASTAGGTVGLLISRYLLREFVEQRFPGRWQAIDRGVDREGVSYLLMLRLMPVVPFFVVNLLMGLTRMRVRTFWWASQLGMLPATCIYVYAGATVPSLQALKEQGVAGLVSWQTTTALILLGLFPLVVRHGVRVWRVNRAS